MKRKNAKKEKSFVPIRRKSFTLVELMVVIAIIVVLAGIAIPVYIHLTDRAKVAAIKNDMGVLATVLETYRTDLSMYPSTADASGVARWVAVDNKDDIFYQELIGGASAKINTGSKLTAQVVNAFAEIAKTDIYSKPLATNVSYLKVSSLSNTSQQYISGATLKNILDPFKASEYIPNDGHIYYKSTDGTNWYLVAYTGISPEVYIWRSNTSSVVSGGTLAQVPELDTGKGALKVTVSGIASGKIANDYTYIANAVGGQPPYLSYTFEGGGTPATQTGTNPRFTTQWAEPANPIVKVTVKDSFGTEAVGTWGVSMVGVPIVSINGAADGKLNTDYTYTPTITGGKAPYTFAWASVGGTPASGTTSSYITQWATPVSQTITLTITDALGQVANCSFNTLIANTLTVSASGPVDGKLNTDYTYSSMVAGGKTPYTYAWEGGGTPATGIASSYTTQWASTGSKTVGLTVTDALGQTLTSSVNVTISGPVVLSVNGPADGRLNTSYTYSSTISGGKTPYTYTWTGGETPASGTASSFTTQWATTGAKTISLTVIDALGQTVNDSVSTGISSLLVASAGGPTAGKLNTDYTYSSVVSGGKTPYTYAWTTVGGSPASSTASSFTTQWASSGSKTVSLTVTDALGQIKSDTVAVTISDVLIASSSGPADGKLSVDYTYTSSVSEGKTPYTYAWTTVGGSPASGTGSSFTTQWATTGSKTVSLTVTDDLGQIAMHSVTTVIVSPLTIAANGPADGKLDSDCSYSVTASGGKTPYTYTWTGGETPASGTASSFTTQWTTTGTKTISLTLTDALGQTASDTVSTAIASTLTVSASGPADGKLNTDYSYTVTVSGGKTPYTYTWTGGETPASGTASSFTTQWATTGAKTISLTVIDALGQTGMDLVGTTIVNALTGSISGPTSGKLSTNYTYTSAISGGKTPYVYAWTTSGGSPASGTSSSFTTQWAATGTKTVNLTVTDALGQIVSDSTDNTIVSAVTVSASGPVDGKLNSDCSYSVSVSGGKTPYTYAWTTTGGSPASGTASTFTTQWASAGSKTVSLTVTDALGQTASDTVSTAIASGVTGSVSGPTSGLISTSYTYTANFSGGKAPLTYAWSNGGTASTSNYSWATPGTYTPSVTVTDALGQFSSGSISVTIQSTLAVTVSPAGAGNVTLSPTGGTYTAGTVVTLTESPAAAYAFSSWGGDGSGTNTTTTVTMNGNKAVTANFTLKTYTLTYAAGSGGTISGTTSQTVNYGGSGTQVTAVPNTGYYFVNWSDGVATAARTDTNVTANKSVTASFAINQYTVTFKDWDGTTLNTQSVNYGGSASAPSNPSRTGYTFAGWDRVLTNITAATTITATYTINTYTLTYAAGSGGTISGTTSQTVNYGGSGTQVTAVPNTGYYFVNWSDGVATAARTDTNVTANKSVTASFAINMYTVTFVDWNSSVLSTQSVAYGGNASAPGNPTRTGYSFAGWSGTYTNVTSARTITATYTAIPLSGYSVTGVTQGKLSTAYTFTANCSGGSGSYTYAWNGGGTGSTKSYSWGSTGAQTVSVTITDAVTGLQVTPSTTCTIYGVPSVTISGTTTTHQGYSYYYTASATGGSGGYTYSWSVGGYGYVSSGQGTSQVYIVWSGAPGVGIYTDANSNVYVTVTDSLGQSCSYTLGTSLYNP